MIKKTKIGATIKHHREAAGLTQKELADKLFITDKAVSKWERGLSYPDVTFLSKLSKILDIDTDALFIEEDKEIAHNWCGLFYFPSKDNGLKLNSKVNDKYILDIIISYFFLVSIDKILIVCDEDNYQFAIRYMSRFKNTNISFKVVKPSTFIKNNGYKNIYITETKVMTIYDLFFIYGVGLTSAFQRSMLDNAKLVVMGEPKIPILFGDFDAVYKLIKNNEYMNCNITHKMFRGYLIFELNSKSKLKKCSNLIEIIEETTGHIIYNPDDIIKIRGL